MGSTKSQKMMYYKWTSFEEIRMSDLEIKHHNGIATLTMNRPEARNALSLEMREELIQALHDVEHDP